MKINKLYQFLTFMVLAVVCATSLGSCSKDDDKEKSQSIVGTWSHTEEYDDEDEYEKIVFTLKFNSDHTGYISEDWTVETKATSHETSRMDFSWSTTSNSSGTDILRISYKSGDKNTELFPGSSSTALWTREFVQTGKILNIYDNGDVWVFEKK